EAVEQPAATGEQCDEGQPHGTAVPEQWQEQVDQPILQRRMIVVGQLEVVRDAYRVVTVETEPDRCGQCEAHDRERRNDRERNTPGLCGKPHRASYTESPWLTPAATLAGAASIPGRAIPRAALQSSKTAKARNSTLSRVGRAEDRVWNAV